MQLIVFRIDGRRHGIALGCVERVARMVEVTPLPKAPDIVLGVLNYRGRVVPVVSLRLRFGMPDRPAALADQLVIARTPRRTVALLADSVEGVVECADDEIEAAQAIVPATGHVAGVVKLSDGLALIHDLSAFLSLDEERRLDAAMADG